MDLDRSSVVTGDYQRVKITELDEIAQPDPPVTDSGHDASSGVATSTARVPRTVEVEVRDTLVNACVPGDLLCIVGIVKTVQVNYH